MALWKVDAEVLNKILTSQIQEHRKRILDPDQAVFIIVVQGWLSIRKSINVINSPSNKNKTILTSQWLQRKHLIKIPLHIKSMQQSRD